MPPSSGRANPAPSNAFKLISILVTLLLMVALVAVIWLVLQEDSPATPITDLPAVMPTVTVSAQGQATDERSASASPTAPRAELPRGGFAFAPPLDYSLTQTDVSATLTGAGDEGALAPVLLLSGGNPSQFVSTDSDGDGVTDVTDLDTLLDGFVTYFSEEDDFDASDPDTLLVDGAPALSVDLRSRSPDNRFAGRIVMAQPTADQLFVMVGVAPETRWENEVAAQYTRVLDSVQLFALGGALEVDEPTAAVAASTVAPVSTTETGAVNLPTPTPLPTASPGPTALPANAALPTPPAALPVNLAAQANPQFRSNANFTNQVALANGNIWTATAGGVAVWNRDNGGLVKFTPFDGLATNHFSSVVACPIPGLGVVFGGDNGLQTFDTRTGSWNSLNRDNSAMSFNDVSTLFCAPEHNFLVVGYREHGLDIFDAVTNKWTHIDRKNGLGSDVVTDVTVVGDRDTIWVSSGAGITALTGDGLPNGAGQLYNAANSPLALTRLTGLAADADGAVWIAGGQRLYRVKDGEWTVYDDFNDNDSGDNDFPTAPLAGLDVAADGRLWLADANAALCRFDPRLERCLELYTNLPGMAAGPVTSVFTNGQGNGEVYYTTNGNGVTRFDGERWQTYDVDGESLPGNQIRTLAQDKSGFLWVATENGVQRFSPAQPAAARDYPFDANPSNANTMPLTAVRAIAPAILRGLWFGGDNGAAFFDESKGAEAWTHFTTADGLVGDRVQALTADRQRRTWIGSDMGLSIWNGESFFNLTRENGLPSEDITALLADVDGSVWIGARNGGLYQFAQNQLQIFTMDNAGLPSDTVTALARANDGAILVGSERGLARFVDRQAIQIDDVPAISIASLTTNGAEIWVGTEGAGIYHFDGETWRQRNSDGIPSPTITALLIDQYGALWAGGTSGGLVRIEE